MSITSVGSWSGAIDPETGKSFGSVDQMDDATYERYKAFNERKNKRNAELFGIGNKYTKQILGTSIYGPTAASGSSGSSGSSSGLFGTGDSLGSMTDQAKDLARFRLGLDKEQGEFSYGLRKKEAEDELGRYGTRAEGDFGRQFKLDTNQRQFDRDINRDSQDAMTTRLDKQLENTLQQQDRNINQENFATGRAIKLASRRLGQ